MKAQAYFEKYKDTIETKEGASALVLEMSNEVQSLVSQRHAVTNDAVVAVLKEINQKWNSLARICEKELKHPVLAEDGLWKFWTYRIPELTGSINKDTRRVL